MVTMGAGNEGSPGDVDSMLNQGSREAAMQQQYSIACARSPPAWPRLATAPQQASARMHAAPASISPRVH